MTQTINPELEALEALTTHPGWKIWCEWYDSEWGGVAFAQKVAGAIGGGMPEAEAVRTLQQTTVALAAVRALREWPEKRLQQLKRQQVPQEQNLSRRGPGL